jgi:hypothetical protein
MADKLQVEYDRADVKLILKRFKLMSDEAVTQAKKVSNSLADKAAGRIKAYAVGSRFIASSRVADNVKVSKTSKIGEFGYGYKSQRFFSGGASTLDMVYGLEFGSNRLPQFPARRREGYFIYPTLRKLQPEIIKEWENAFTDILKEFDK